MSDVLFKVSAPRANWTFEPSRFWRTEDWSSSTDNPRAGYIEDWVLYAAEYNEVNIHLLPRVWRLRVWLNNTHRSARLRNLGYMWSPNSRAVIVARESDRACIESFIPTVYTFEPSGFEQIPSNEYIARTPQTAIAADIIPFGEAIRRWQFDVMYVEDAEACAQSLRSHRIEYQIQT